MRVTVVAIGLLCSCDCGLVSTGNRPFAVGATGKVGFVDLCAQDTIQSGTKLIDCKNESVTSIDSAKLGEPFEIVMIDDTAVVVTAKDAGSTNLDLEVTIVGGEKRSLGMGLEAHVIDRVELRPQCTLTDAGFALAVDQRAWILMYPMAGRKSLITTGAPIPLTFDGLVVDNYTPSEASRLSGSVSVHGPDAGLGRIRSNEDARVAVDIDIVAPSDITLAWTSDRAFLAGRTAQVTATAKGPSGRSLCALPADFEVTSLTPDVCHVGSAPGKGLSGGVFTPTATVRANDYPAFNVVSRDAGQCDVDVRDGDAGRWVTTVHLQ